MKHTPLPGTPSSIDFYQQRATQRKRVTNHEDARPDEHRSPLLTRRRNGIVEVKDEGTVEVKKNTYEKRLTDVSLPEGMPAKIRILRRICGLSQRQLANKSGLPRITIQSWERGSRIPTIKSLKILAVAFGVTVGKLCE